MDPVTATTPRAPAGDEADAAAGATEPCAELPADLSAALLALITNSRSTQTEVAKNQIATAEDLVELARVEVRAAMDRAADAEGDACFWGDLSNVLGGDVATIAGIVAAAAVVIGTGGLGAPAMLAIAAAGLSAGASVGQRIGLDPKICAALGAGGALLGVAGGGLASAAGIAGTVATGARVVQAGATAASGATRVAEGEYRASALDARADQVEAEHRERDAWLRIDSAIGVIEKAAEDLQRARAGAAAIQRTTTEANSAVIARIGAM